MDRGAQEARPLGRLGRWSLIGFCILSWLFLHLTLSQHGKRVREGSLVDTDCYTRLVRVQQLLDSHDWYDTRIPRFNYPTGGGNHWTRPFDLLLIAGMVCLRPILPPTEALFWAGALVSPFLHLLACLAIFWAVRPLVREQERLLTTVAFIWQLGILGYCLIGRSDHHSLITLLYVVTLGFLLRTAEDPVAPTTGIGLGLSMAAGMWVSVEGQVPVAVGMAFLAIGWWWGSIPAQRGVLPGCWWYLAGVALAIAVERPPAEWLIVENDKISAIHLAEAVAMIGFWRWLAAVEGGRLPRTLLRGLALAVGAAIAGGGLLFLFPDITQIPIPGIDAQMMLFWNKIAENQPLWPPTLPNLRLFLIFLGQFAFGWPLLVGVVLLNRRNEERLPTWIAVIAWSLLFSLMTVFRVRFQFLAEVPLALAPARVIRDLTRWAETLQRPLVRAFFILALPSFLLMGPFFACLLLPSGPTPAEAPRVDMKLVAADLNDPAIVSSSPATILAWVNYGPELVYRTPHRLVAAPYHRDLSGLRDAMAVLGAEDDAPAREVLSRRQAGFLLIREHDGSFVLPGVATVPTGCLQERLSRGEIPDWLEAVPLPRSASAGFRLFRVSP